MRKTKNILLLLGVAIMIATPLAVFLPQGQGTSYADTPPGGGLQWTEAPTKPASGSWWSQATVKDRVDAYAYIAALSYCINTSPGSDMAVEDVASGNFFSDDSVDIGHYLLAELEGADGNNGKTSCQDDEGRRWIRGLQDIISATGLISADTGDSKDDDSFIALACYLGWTRENQSGAGTKSCASGSGKFYVPRGAGTFKESITNKLAGAKTTAPYSLLSVPDQYYLFSQTLIRACITPSGESLGSISEVNNDVLNLAQEGQSDGDSNYYMLSVVVDGESGPKVDTIIYNGSNDRNNNKIIAIKSDYSRWNPDCSEIEKLANARASEARDFVVANPEQGISIFNAGNGKDRSVDPSSGISGTESGLDLDCAGFEFKTALSLDWLVCPMIQGLMNMASELEDRIAGELCISESDIFGAQATCPGSSGSNSTQTSEAYYKAWSIFRAIALGILVIGGLVMILSQGLGFEVFDAYTVKRTLPRLLIAAIAISLSWPVMEFLVSFSNVLGLGVRGIIYAPFQGMGDGDIMTGTASALAVLFSAGAFVSLGAMGLLSFVGTAVLAIIIAFFIIVIRNILLIFLILIAPVAIALYILPNTEKYFKGWWSLFTKVLIVFPIITGMIALGHVFAAITFNKGDSLLETIVAFIAYFAPYFLIPAAFRFAGGALATIGGFANDRSRGGFDRLKKFRQGESAKNMQAVRENRRFNPNANGVVGKINRRVNSGLSNISSPVGSAKYYGGNALRAMGANTSIGQGIGNQIDESRFQASQKATEYLMNKQFNDQALRSLMGMKEVNASSIREEAARLGASSDVNARIASNQLSSYATTLATDLYKDPEMGRANIQAAAGMALAQHGFADPDDIAQLGNNLGGTESGFANAVVGQAQMNAMRAGRSDFKPGYSVRLGPGGKFEGTTDFESRTAIGDKPSTVTKSQQDQIGRARAGQVARLKGIGTYELQQSKPQAINGLAEGYKHVLRDAPGEYSFVDDRGQTSTYSFSQADKDRILDQFANLKSPHSGANPDQIDAINKILEGSGMAEEVQRRIERQGPSIDDPEQSGRIPKKDH